MWKGPGQLELGHVGPARLSCAPPLGMVPLPFGESPLLHLQCVQQTPLPGVEGWEHHTSLANHSTYHTRSGPREWYRPVLTTGTSDGTIGNGF